MNPAYRTERGEIVVTDRGTGRLVWRGKPDGQPVSILMPLPDSEDCIALLDPDAGPIHDAFRNLVRCRPDGTVVWRADLPDWGMADGYVEMTWVDDGLAAHSWSGYWARINPETGAIMSVTFTK